jgi:drug/metabolite transporter (DMT)-like permease
MKLTPRFSYAALALAGSLWGLGFVFGKVALDSQMPVGAMVTWRFIVATLVLLPWTVTPKARSLLRPRTLMALAVAGVLYVPIQFLVQFEGLKLTSVTHASLMVAMLPGLLALGSVIVLRQRLTAWTSAAIALSMIGAAVIVLRPDRTASVAGDVLVALSLICTVTWILFTQRALRDTPPIEMTAFTIAFGTIVLIGYEMVREPHALVHAYSLAAWLAVIAVGILSTAASTVLWNVALGTVNADRAGVFLNLEPLVGAVCGVAFFSEPAGVPLYIGATLVLGGAFMITSS